MTSKRLLQLLIGIVVLAAVLTGLSRISDAPLADNIPLQILVGFGVVVVTFGIYFLPTVIGWHKRNHGAILALNTLLGWTVIGWVIALVWALTIEEKRA